MRAIAISIAVLLCAFAVSADPLQRKTFATAAPCVPNTEIIVTDDATAGACAGGGAVESLCICSDDGTAIAAPGVTGASGSHPIADGTEVVQGSDESTRQMRFELDTDLDGNAGVTAGNTRVMHVPDEDIDLHDSQTDHEERYGIANIKDFGAISDAVGTTDDTAAIQAAIDYCQNTFKSAIDSRPLCRVYFPPGVWEATQIVVEAWVMLYGAGRDNTTLWQPAGTNLDLIRHSEKGSDDSLHGGGVTYMRLNKERVGADVYTQDTVGSGIIFCAGSQAELHEIHHLDITRFPDAGIRYGCPDDYFGSGDPTGVGGNNGGYVPGAIDRVSLFGNGIAGLWFEENRLVASTSNNSNISGDGNGWRHPDYCEAGTNVPFTGCTGVGTGDATLIGSQALIYIEGGCGGGGTCGSSHNFTGIKAECGPSQKYALHLKNLLLSAVNIDHGTQRCGTDLWDDSSFVFITDDDPGVGNILNRGKGCTGSGTPHACCTGVDAGATCAGWSSAVVTWTSLSSLRHDHFIYDESGAGSPDASCNSDAAPSGYCPWQTTVHTVVQNGVWNPNLMQNYFNRCQDLPYGTTFLTSPDHATDPNVLCYCDSSGDPKKASDDTACT